MLRNLSIKHRLFAIVGLAVIGLAVIAGNGLWELKQGLMQDRQISTREHVELATSVATEFHRRVIEEGMDETAAQQQASATIQMLRYDGGNYFWINDLAGKLVMHPRRMDQVGELAALKL